jgi:hypothetical protein
MGTLWQPVTWVIFHFLTKEYNHNYREHYVTFFDTFKTIIPCGICRTHFTQSINKPGLNIEDNVNQDRIFNWTVNLHNMVNKMNYKKQWNHDEARRFYESRHLNNNLFKIFILEYTRSNFQKNPHKTENLMRMLKSIAYLHPNEEKRNKLIEFKEKFELNRNSFKNWLTAFLVILK